jgi:signal transduction histidine kinase/CheY-like chemotaxis protein
MSEDEIRSLARLNEEQNRRIEELSQAHAEVQAINRRLEDTQQQLLQSEKMASIGQLAAGVAHEINNPLAAIIGFTQIQLRGSPPTADRLALETVLGEARRAARIVKDLLTIARREESIHRQPVSLNEAVSYILSTQRYAIETRGIRVEFIASPTPVVVRGDPTQLEQVFLNLLVNARQALETRSERVRREPRPHGSDWTPFISVRTGIIGDHARVEIADNGDGISAADLPHIWDPFWTKREEGEGSGLGLSVVHGIVTSHGGAIDVKSDEGQGTVLTIFLPRELEPAAQLQERPSVNLRDRDPVPRPLDILVVDDEAVLLDLLRRIFSSRGHAVVVAMDGLQAIRLAEQSTFDVVVCDLRMPGMDGRDVIDRLAQLPTCARTRFVLSTGDASSSADLFAPGSRVDAIVSKPYSVDTLLEVVERNTAP